MNSDYIELSPGDVLQNGDEYNTEHIWRPIPDFMIGDVIPDGNDTKWRRSAGAKSSFKKHWWSKK